MIMDRDRVFWLDISDNPCIRDQQFQCTALPHPSKCDRAIRYMEARFRRVGQPVIVLTYAARCEHHYRSDRLKRKAPK